MTRLALVAVATAIILPSLASAAPPWRGTRISDAGVYHLNMRVQRQYERIYAGLADGSLTRREGRRLLRAERRIERRLSRGYLSPHQRMHVRRMLQVQSRRITQARHNRIYRGHHRFERHRGDGYGRDHDARRGRRGHRRGR